MTNEEAKEKLYLRSPVMHRGVKYERITAIIYRVTENNRIVVSAELKDKNENSITYARIEEVQECE